MPKPSNNEPNIKKKTNFVFILVSSFWTLLILGLSWHSYDVYHENALMIAKSSAVDSFQKDLVYRKWASVHGGVYVPVTDFSPPNPYLINIPNRDVEITPGNKFTLINPAYMTRQVHELGLKDYGLRGHITSLNPLRPENAPDEWERKALQSFEKGTKEFSSLDYIGNDKYFRFMAPMLTEQSCLKCHDHQGYKVGDLRGGISVSVPWDSFQSSINNGTRNIVGVYSLIWFIGIVGIVVAKRAIFNHVTQQEIALDSLGKSEKILSTVLRATPVGIGLVQNRIIRWNNEALSKISGYSKDELYGKSTRIFYETDLEFQHVGKELYSKVSSTGNGSIETRHVHKNGSVFDVLLGLETVDRSDPSSGYVFALMDISDSKKAAQQIQQNMVRLERAEQGAQFGNWELDINTNVIKLSQGASRILGLPTDKIELPEIRRLPLPEYKTIVNEALVNLIERSQPYDIEFKVVRQTDKKIIDVHSIAEIDLNSKTVWGVIQDVTSRKEAEEALVEMERRVFQSQKLESLGVLSGGIAHDFNNLLAVIVGNLELVLDADFPWSDKEKFIQRAMSASMKSASLVRQMLDYSGKGAFELHDVNLHELAEKNAEMFRLTTPKNISLNVRTVNEDVTIKADSNQIQQVFMNLLINASESIEDKIGTVELSTGVEYCDSALLARSLLLEKPEPQKMAFIRVKDNGCGMDKETVQRIFEPFFSTKFTGRGLGMSVVQGIARGHHGAVTIDTQQGIGTTITVYFPISLQTEPGVKPDSNEQ